MLVADDFELDPIRQPNLTRQPCGANGFVGGVTGGCVRQDEDFLAVNVIEQRLLASIGKVYPANGDGDHVRTARGVGASHFLKAAVLPGTDNEARVESTACNHKCVWHDDLEIISVKSGGVRRHRRKGIR